MIHVPVLLQEVIEGLALQNGDILIDGTLGNAGHTKAILDLGLDIKIIGIDKDEDALERSRKLLGDDSRVTLVQGSYADLESILEKLGIPNITKALFDFGFSSDQIENSGRGFTFQKNEPLLMTYERDPKEETVTARDMVNLWDEDTIRTIIRSYGDERFAGRIAKGIVKARESKPIETTDDLIAIIKAATPAGYGRGKIHPATRTFQALRIAVNDELTTVTNGIEAAFRALSPHGRIAAISFHSHEDRIVKHHFKSWVAVGSAIAVTKKPIVPKQEEVERNPRSRSSKLRVIEKA